MHIFVFIKYLPSTDMRSTNTRYYALPGFVRNTSTFKTMDYHVSRYHVGWSYQLHVMIGSHDLTRMVFVLSAMILHIQYIYEYT
jgi:hypothetical protein